MIVKYICLRYVVIFSLLLGCSKNSTNNDEGEITNDDKNGIIAFYSERDGNSEIYIINADGGSEKRLTINSTNDIAPDISPDGSKIVFVSNRDGNDEIYLMNNDGTNVIRLTNTPESDSYPFWSSDGSKIIFCSMRDNGQNYEIYLMDSTGTNQRRLTSNSVSEEWAHLSPDMQKITYSVGPFPNYDIYLMDVDGSNQHIIFNSDSSAAIPKWSRDGGCIAFNHFVFSSGNIIGDICIIDSTGTNAKQLTNTSGNAVSENPYWSPDNQKIVYQSNTTGNFQIYIIDADGNNRIRLTNHSGNDFWPSWASAESIQ